MSTQTRVSDPKIVKTLKQALRHIQTTRAAYKRECEQELAALDERERILSEAIASFHGPRAQQQQSEAPRIPISDDRLDKIRAYAKSQKRFRQQSVADFTDLNTGVVSLGLRRLAELGEVKAASGEKERGSQVWEYMTSHNGHNPDAAPTDGDEKVVQETA